MNDKIIDFFKNQPMLYAESDDVFWDDEHISKHMLAAHLDPNCNDASRKQDGIINSANWIAELCGGSEKKKLLDLGCGPGIYAELLAEKGFQVTGIDFSKRSIDYAIDSFILWYKGSFYGVTDVDPKKTMSYIEIFVD